MKRETKRETERETEMDMDMKPEMIDYTFLKAAGEPDAVRRLCREAKRCRFGCVMVNPAEVRSASRLLKGSGVRVGTVVGFPLGAKTIETKKFEAVQALKDGALDIDMVVNIRQLKASVRASAERAALLADLTDFVKAVKGIAPAACTKIILECCYLTDREKRLGCRLAQSAGFDFVKTSTGFGIGGATVEDVRLMRKAVGPHMGVKAAGGIRTLADALAMVEAGANRIGCSAMLLAPANMV